MHVLRTVEYKVHVPDPFQVVFEVSGESKGVSKWFLQALDNRRLLINYTSKT